MNLGSLRRTSADEKIIYCLIDLENRRKQTGGKWEDTKRVAIEGPPVCFEPDFYGKR